LGGLGRVHAALVDVGWAGSGPRRWGWRWASRDRQTHTAKAGAREPGRAHIVEVGLYVRRHWLIRLILVSAGGAEIGLHRRIKPHGKLRRVPIQKASKGNFGSARQGCGNCFGFAGSLASAAVSKWDGHAVVGIDLLRFPGRGRGSATSVTRFWRANRLCSRGWWAPACRSGCNSSGSHVLPRSVGW